MSNNALEIKDVTKKYKDFTLNNISFSIPKGTVMGLIGQNGAGKTTCIKLIMNIIGKNSGSIKVFDMDNIENEIEVKNKIGYVADEDYLYISANLLKFSQAFKVMFDNWDDELFKKYVDMWKLPMKKNFYAFSKGMKTKAMLALTLAHKPELLILDEPTAGLDPVARIEVLDILRDFVSDGEKAVLFSTHLTSDLDKIADYITLIIDGNIKESMSIDKIEEKYAVIMAGTDSFKGKEDKCIGIRKGSISSEALILRENIKYFYDATVSTPNIEQLLTFNIWANNT